jgi:hypothetical protein
MARNPLKDGPISKHSTGISTATRKMLRGRAEELAMHNNRWLREVTSSDFAQARHELMGEPDMAVQEATL